MLPLGVPGAVLTYSGIAAINMPQGSSQVGGPATLGVFALIVGVPLLVIGLVGLVGFRKR